MTDLTFTDVRSDGEFDRYLSVEAESFAEPAGDLESEARVARKHALLRIGSIGDEVVAGYCLMGVGQFFGGMPVPAQAVTSVFVHPAWRRRGIAGALLRDLVDVCRAMPTAIAPLYASTTRLYRRFGWEVGDRTLWCDVRADALAHLHGEGELRAQPRRADVEVFRRAHVCRFDGPLDRPEWWLEAHWDSEGKEDGRRAYGWFEGDRMTGHVAFRQSFVNREVRISVQDMTAATPGATRGLLGFLGGHDAVVSHVTLKRATVLMHDLMFLLPDVDKLVTVAGSTCWMQRLVDLDLAVRSRGWLRSANARLELELSDPCADQPQRVVLEVAGGEGHVSRGGGGRVRCGVGALSAWYSSRLTAWDAHRLSLLDAAQPDIELMDGLIERRRCLEPDYF